VPSTLPCDRAFAAIVANKVAAVGVVEAQSGALVACLSESDMRGLSTSHFGSLALPVAQFLVHTHGLSVPETPTGATATVSDPWAAALAEAKAAICLPPEASFAGALRAVVENKVHRVFICEPETARPIAVVTHAKLLQTLIFGHLNK
jgi:hypothetical protein